MRLKPSKAQKAKSIAELTAILIMSASIVFFAVIYTRLPAGHEYSSAVFAWRLDSGKSVLFIPFAINTVIDILLIIIYRFPGYQKYPVEITAENIEAQYHMAKMLINIELILTGLFFIFLYLIIYFRKTGNPLSGYMPALAVFPALAAAVYIIYITTAKKYK